MAIFHEEVHQFFHKYYIFLVDPLLCPGLIFQFSELGPFRASSIDGLDLNVIMVYLSQYLADSRLSRLHLFGSSSNVPGMFGIDLAWYCFSSSVSFYYLLFFSV
jgi:hypothetical protein